MSYLTQLFLLLYLLFAVASLDFHICIDDEVYKEEDEEQI